jgi:hypothetical protein
MLGSTQKNSNLSQGEISHGLNFARFGFHISKTQGLPKNKSIY